MKMKPLSVQCPACDDILEIPLTITLTADTVHQLVGPDDGVQRVSATVTGDTSVMREHAKAKHAPPEPVKGVCKCGRKGSCGTCCCIAPIHKTDPDRACALCKHSGGHSGGQS